MQTAAAAACLANCFVHGDREPRELPAVCPLAGVIAEQRGWWRYASLVYALLRSYRLSRIAVRTIRC